MMQCNIQGLQDPYSSLQCLSAVKYCRLNSGIVSPVSPLIYCNDHPGFADIGALIIITVSMTLNLNDIYDFLSSNRLFEVILVL